MRANLKKSDMAANGFEGSPVPDFFPQRTKNAIDEVPDHGT